MAVISSLRAFQDADECGGDFLTETDAVGVNRMLPQTGRICQNNAGVCLRILYPSAPTGLARTGRTA